MTTAYTSLLGLALPVTGELSGTWGDTVNNSITSLLDSAVAGTTNVSTDADVTLTTTTGAANTAREAILLFSGARTALRTVTAPAQSKIYTVINATTGGYSVKLVGAGPTTGVTIVAGESAVCAWNGSDFVKVSNTGGSVSFTNVTVSGTTTLSGLTASTALALDASKNVVSVTNTGTGNNVLSASPTLTGTIGAAALTLSSDLTLSGGTANGVAYLNGSKVVTSGSALTFDGTNLGIGATSPARPLDVRGSLGMQVNEDSVGTKVISIRSNFAGAGPAINVTTNDPLLFLTNNTEQMRLTSTGLGIGTSSPQARLNVVDASSANNGTIWLGSATYYGTVKHNASGTGANEYNVATASGGGHQFQRGGTTLMDLNQNGNLGLGVTPSANNGVRTLIVADQGGTLNALTLGAKTGGYGEIGYGFGFNGSAYKYLISDSASKISFNAGGIQFSTAASGTAGNAITFTQAMTLDASGNLFLGATSQAYAEKFRMSGNYAVFENGTYTGFIGAGISMGSGTNTDFGIRSNAAIAFLAGGGTERARIDSSGKFLVGTTSIGTSDRVCFASPQATLNTLSLVSTDDASGGNFAIFRNSAYTLIGSITRVTTTNAVTYNTTSDYRLKTVVGAVTGQGERIDALNPINYLWKEGGQQARGFLAHEFQTVYPSSVNGEKDAVDENGNPVYQGMQASTAEVIADLVAEIQSLRQRVAQLEAQ